MNEAIKDAMNNAQTPKPASPMLGGTPGTVSGVDSISQGTKVAPSDAFVVKEK